ncbi:hypothetical protein N7532_009343 [Penicillium argentinense]|uniref:O-methylsterigmatocystin oxidoreductase n=1 Tax=Penicillium argentinense TaxID=1131581 RepID=A0A9W9K2F2_9EURO|nr:uncharacterized protein N7532_009343 [Penicillium argentinense]KAJ5090659.1 hypothetical protein N7532_009343 [Penicillium argentinense]
MILATKLGILATSVALLACLKGYFSRRKLPPGPRGWPVIGNLFDLLPDGQHPGEFYARYKALYGPLSSLTVFGQPIIIVNDRKTAAQLFDKSAKHSSRPQSVFADGLCGYGKSIPRQNNTPLLRAYRRATAQVIGTKSSAAKFDHHLENEFRRLLWRIQQDPDGLLDHCRIATGSFVLKITYGYNVDPHQKDSLIDLADLVLKQFSEAITPGKFLVDLIPALQHLPEWVPGTGFKKIARFNKETILKLTNYPFEFTKWQMRHKENKPSFVSESIKHGEDAEITKWAAGAIYGAGTDTTVGLIEGFFLAMMNFPGVQRKAQAELDRVIGEDRFPSVADRPNLPYIDGVLKETMRWHTVAVMTPRKSDEDEVINGYLVPRGAILMANIWAMNNDPEIYPNPSDFRPERYLPAEGQEIAPDPHDNTFGFGRRICPGRITAETSIFLAIVHTLFAFDIKKPVGEDGNVLESELRPTPEFISHPAPYKCSLTVRSPRREQLMLGFMREHPFEPSDAGKLQKAVKAVSVLENS